MKLRLSDLHERDPVQTQILVSLALSVGLVNLIEPGVGERQEDGDVGHIREAIDDSLALKDPCEDLLDAGVVHIQLVLSLRKVVRYALEDLG